LTESELHRLVKNGVATALSQDGFNVNTEYTSKEGEGIIDIYAEKSDGTLVKVEVVKTHIPNWLLIKLTGHEKQSNLTTVQLKKATRARLDNQGFRHESYDGIINRLIDEHESETKK